MKLIDIWRALRRKARRATAAGDNARAHALSTAADDIKPELPKPRLPKPSLDHKVWVPGARREPIAQTSSDPDIIPAGAIFHIAVTNAADLRDLFLNDGGIESTGYILFDGSVIQYRPLTVQCDAQFDGNSFSRADGLYGFSSFESQGGVPNGEGGWTDAQLATIKKIIAFHHDQWGIPLRQTPDWNADGFGYHRLFDRWNKNHHSCPGDGRVKQWHDIIVPWMKSGGR